MNRRLLNSVTAVALFLAEAISTTLAAQDPPSDTAAARHRTASRNHRAASGEVQWRDDGRSR